MFPLLQHVNALGRPRGDVSMGVARLVGTKLRPPLITPHRRLRRSRQALCHLSPE